MYERGFSEMAAKKVNKEDTITYKGVKYRLVFNLNVMEEVQNEYGSVTAWLNMVSADEEPNIKALKYGLTKAINEGIDIYNDENDAERPFFSEKQIGRIITEVGLTQATTALNNVVIESTKTDEKNL